MDSSLAHALRKAIEQIERKFPQFREESYKPNPTETEAFGEYRTLQDELQTANIGESLSRFLEEQSKKSRRAKQSLQARGLLPLEPLKPPPQELPKRVELPLLIHDAQAAPKAEENKTKQRRGPKANMEYHRAVADIVKPYGDNWRKESTLEKITGALDRNKDRTPPLKAWAHRPWVCDIEVEVRPRGTPPRSPQTGR